jgi:hypothetical protein
VSLIWIPFDWRLGSRQQLPEERKYVLCLVKSAARSSPQGVGVGYLRYAAGDADSPFFVVPGLHPVDGVVFAWADCLPDEFRIPDVDPVETFVSAVMRQAMLWGAAINAIDREAIVADWDRAVSVESSARRIAGLSERW